MGQITAVGIKKILYADTSKIAADLTPDLAKTLIKAAITAKDEVRNVHQETWNVEEAEASVTGYKTNPGDMSVNFTIGQYEYATKAALMGGTAIKRGGAGSDKDDIVGWKRSNEKVVIKKALFCLTDDGVWLIFTNAQITAHEANTDKAVAIAVKALVQTPEVAGVSMEYNFDEAVVKALV